MSLPLTDEEVWTKLPLTEAQRGDMVRSMIEEKRPQTEHMIKSIPNMTSLDQMDEADLLISCLDLLKLS